MMTRLKMLVVRLARSSIMPGWTLLAISFLISAMIVIALRLMLEAGCAFVSEPEATALLDE